MKITILALGLVAGATTTGAAKAALITRSYTTTSTYAANDDGMNPPYPIVVQNYALSYDPANASAPYTLTNYSSTQGPVFSLMPTDVSRAVNATNNFMLSAWSDKGDYFTAVNFDIDGRPIDPEFNAANYSYFDGDFNRIQFYASSVKTVIVTTPAVLEPATWSMMLVGFGTIGASMRRRTRAAIRFA